MEQLEKEIEQQFQYILCYGSTFIELLSSIKLQLFQYILCYGST